MPRRPLASRRAAAAARPLRRWSMRPAGRETAASERRERRPERALEAGNGLRRKRPARHPLFEPDRAAEDRRRHVRMTIEEFEVPRDRFGPLAWLRVELGQRRADRVGESDVL